MTYHIRHHTSQLDARARKVQPVFEIRNDPFPQHYEAAYAKAMQALAKQEKRKPRLPVSERRDVVAAREAHKKFRDTVLSILAGMPADATTRQITAEVTSSSEFEKAAVDRVGAALSRLAAQGLVTMRIVGKNRALWNVARVTTSDRLAMAKREAGE